MKLYIVICLALASACNAESEEFVAIPRVTTAEMHRTLINLRDSSHANQLNIAQANQVSITQAFVLPSDDLKRRGLGVDITNMTGIKCMISYSYDPSLYRLQVLENCPNDPKNISARTKAFKNLTANLSLAEVDFWSNGTTNDLCRFQEPPRNLLYNGNLTLKITHNRTTEVSATGIQFARDNATASEKARFYFGTAETQGLKWSMTNGTLNGPTYPVGNGIGLQVRTDSTSCKDQGSNGCGFRVVLQN